MDRIQHDDSTCTVGWTNISASMDIDDMEWLLRMEPRGSFTPLFHPTMEHSCGNFSYSWKTNTGVLENMRLLKSLPGEQTFGALRSFGFSFPETNITLLTALRIKGMEVKWLKCR
jgi:hypothetical protein